MIRLALTMLVLYFTVRAGMGAYIAVQPLAHASDRIERALEKAR